MKRVFSKGRGLVLIAASVLCCSCGDSIDWLLAGTTSSGNGGQAVQEQSAEPSSSSNSDVCKKVLDQYQVKGGDEKHAKNPAAVLAMARFRQTCQ